MPRVSVIVPAYNAGAVIRTAIASVASQTFRDLEVIVVDDASTDDTVAKAVAALETSGLKHALLTSERNSGPAAARNRGVATAPGEYVAFLDSDDEWLPPKVASQLRVLDENPAVTLCGCQAHWINEEQRVVEPLFTGLPEFLPHGWKMLLWSCYIATPCAMVRRDDLGVRPFDTSLRVGGDRDLWIKLASNGTVALVQDVLVRIRLSSGSFMRNNRDLMLAHTRPMLQRHLAAFADELGWRDRARALGSLNSQIGKTLCRSRSTYMRGAGHLMRAIALGFRPADNLRELVYTAPVLRELKEYVKQRLAERQQAGAAP